VSISGRVGIPLLAVKERLTFSLLYGEGSRDKKRFPRFCSAPDLIFDRFQASSARSKNCWSKGIEAYPPLPRLWRTGWISELNRRKGRKIMKNRKFIVLVTLSMVVALFLGFAATVRAQEGKGIELGETVVITAEVLAIDREDRILTLLGPKKNVVDVHVGEEARNFDQIRVGDQLRIEYYESVAIYLGKPGTQPEADAGAVVARSTKGEKPGGYAVGAIDVSASVVGIDKKKRTLTLELPEGNVVTTEVDKSVKAFDTLKVGDAIHARLTKAIAISVEKP
jgi:hypothetical protein